MNESKVKATKVKQRKQMSTNTVRVIESLKAIFLALLIGVVLIVITGQTSSLKNFFENLWNSNFKDSFSVTEWLATMSYLIPLGLALAVSFRMGIFNIGAAGQAIGGGTVAYIVASKLSIGQYGWIATILVGVFVGMMIAMLIAFLKNKFGINEVVSSIMINWIIFYIVKYLVTSAHGGQETISIDPNNDLRLEFIYNLFNDSSKRLNVGLFIVIPVALILWYAYAKTNWGYKQEILGNNSEAGKYIGVEYKSEIYKTMAISGALAGLAGVIYYTGYETTLMYSDATELPMWSFNGITIALLGFNSPIGVILASGVFAVFNSTIDTTIGNIGITDVIVASMIIFIAISNYRITYGKRKLFSRGGK